MYDCTEDDLTLGGAVIAAALGLVPAVDFRQQVNPRILCACALSSLPQADHLRA